MGIERKNVKREEERERGYRERNIWRSSRYWEKISGAQRFEDKISGKRYMENISRVGR